jgi:hypothetical protein
MSICIDRAAEAARFTAEFLAHLEELLELNARMAGPSIANKRTD